MDYRANIEAIRGAYQRGNITLEEAKKQVEPMLGAMNKKGEIIAKKFGKKHKKLTFGYVFR